MKNKSYFNRVASEWDSMQQDFYSDCVREAALRIAADIGAGTIYT
jgi:hypothetical protein